MKARWSIGQVWEVSMFSRVRSLGALALVSALTACNNNSSPGGGGGAPSAGPPKEYTGEPSQMPPGAPVDGAVLVEDVAFNTPNPPFVDAVSAEAMASGSFQPGRWTSGNGFYAQEDPGASTKLSIRRYTGSVGSRYRVEVTGWIFREFTSDPARDPSVFSLLPFYKDETHYVICSTGANVAETWICSGQMPGTTWPTSNKLWGAMLSPARTVGVPTTWTCDVDTNANSLTIYLDGDRKATVITPFLAGTGGIALASNGSQIKFAHFKVFSLTGSTPATTSPVPTVPPPLNRVPPRPTPTLPPAPGADEGL